MKELVKRIFEEVIAEAQNGKVKIDGDEHPIMFNTNITAGVFRANSSDSSVPCLNINDYDRFIDALVEYVLKELEYNRRHAVIAYKAEEEETHIKMIIANLFVNATNYDFNNPIPFIKMRMEFLGDTTFQDFSRERTFLLQEPFANCYLSVTDELDSINNETPHKMTFKIKCGGDTYYLPSISYGIHDNICYIYGIINRDNKKNKDSKFGNKINRLLFKLNDGVIDFIQYLKNNRQGYYPENITDVTLSFVFAMSIFLQLLYSKQVSDIRAVTFLPVRYTSRDIASDNEEKRTRNDIIQSNATDKFIRLFNRVAYHINGLTVTSDPFIEDELMCLKIGPELGLDDGNITRIRLT